MTPALLYSVYRIIWNEGGLLLQSPHWIKMPGRESAQIHSSLFSKEQWPLAHMYNLFSIRRQVPSISFGCSSPFLSTHWIVIGYLNLKEWCYILEGGTWTQLPGFGHYGVAWCGDRRELHQGEQVTAFSPHLSPHRENSSMPSFRYLPGCHTCVCTKICLPLLDKTNKGINCVSSFLRSEPIAGIWKQSTKTLKRNVINSADLFFCLSWFMLSRKAYFKMP